MAKKNFYEQRVLKDDGVFRIFQKTNSMKAKYLERIELPNNEVHQRNSGNMPRFEVAIPYIGETFELYDDDKLVGLRVLNEASKEYVRYSELEQKL